MEISWRVPVLERETWAQRSSSSIYQWFCKPLIIDLHLSVCHSHNKAFSPTICAYPYYPTDSLFIHHPSFLAHHIPHPHCFNGFEICEPLVGHLYRSYRSFTGSS